MIFVTTTDSSNQMAFKFSVSWVKFETSALEAPPSTRSARTYRCCRESLSPNTVAVNLERSEADHLWKP
jgi:hypothetical protein